MEMPAGSNGTCIFPFKHNGIWNWKCKDPEDYGGVGWCSFDSIFGGEASNRWGYCTANCPSDYDDPCDGIVCNVPGEKCVNGQCKCGSACSCEFNPAGRFCDSNNSICKCSATEDACKDDLPECDPVLGKCAKCAGTDGCCTKDNQCDVGEGDCHRDGDCKEGLKCGVNNCAKCVMGAWTATGCGLWTINSDCCYDPNNMVCNGGDSCCQNINGKCGIGEGDCDYDSHCKDGLKCGTDNCMDVCKIGGVDCTYFQTAEQVGVWINDPNPGDDCCYKPE